MDDELVIDVKGMAEDALRTRQPDEDLDEALLRAAKTRYGDRALEVFTALKAALDLQVQRSGHSREEALAELSGPMIVAKSVSSVSKTFSFGAKPAPGGGKVLSRTFTFGTSAKSLDDLPLEVRTEVAQALEEAAHRIEAGSIVAPDASAAGEEDPPLAPTPFGQAIDQLTSPQKPRSLLDRLRSLLD